MAQLNITLDTELLHGLFTKDIMDEDWMQMQVGLMLTCLNLKKMKQRLGLIGPFSLRFFWFSSIKLNK